MMSFRPKMDNFIYSPQRGNKSRSLLQEIADNFAQNFAWVDYMCATLSCFKEE